MIKDVKKLVNYVSVFRPRLMHLQAYYSTLTRSPSRATYLAKKSAEIAEKMGNLLECDWVNHNVEVQLNLRRLFLSRDFKKWLLRLNDKLCMYVTIRFKISITSLVDRNAQINDKGH